MIVDSGKLALLNAQLSYLSGLYWMLFTNNASIANNTVLGDLTEAGWTGYARVLAGSWTTPTLVPPRAVTNDNTNPIFSNSSGNPQTCYGWGLVDYATNTLIAAVNLGATTIPDGSSFVLAPSVTDNEE